MATCKRCGGRSYSGVVEYPPHSHRTARDATGTPNVGLTIGDFLPVPCPDCKGTGEVKDDAEVLPGLVVPAVVSISEDELKKAKAEISERFKAYRTAHPPDWRTYGDSEREGDNTNKGDGDGE